MARMRMRVRLALAHQRAAGQIPDANRPVPSGHRHVPIVVGNGMARRSAQPHAISCSADPAARSMNAELVFKPGRRQPPAAVAESHRAHAWLCSASFPLRLPVATSHDSTRRSLPDDTSVVPSGENATARTQSRVADQTLDQRAVIHVPEANHVIVAGRRHQPAARLDGQRRHDRRKLARTIHRTLNRPPHAHRQQRVRTRTTARRRRPPTLRRSPP